MWAIGAISGTSMDGIDVALVETDGRERVRCGPGATYPYDSVLRTDLLQAAAAQTLSTAEIARLDAGVTEAHVAAIARFALESQVALAAVAVVGLHGQTIRHQPEVRRTLQLGSGDAASRSLGTAVVADFRQADVAAGGQGAPLAPLYHRAMLGAPNEPTIVLNLGGVGNVTFLDGEAVIAFDTGPASALLDDFMLRRCGVGFDQGGVLAASGTPDLDLVAAFLADPFFTRPPPKSLDRHHFHAYAATVEHLSDADGAATLAAFTIASVEAAMAHVPRPPARWFVSGGGRHNDHLMQSLQCRLGVSVQPVEAAGFDGDLIEAQAFAYLAVRSLAGLPLSLPTTTGVPRPMPGGVLHRPPCSVS